MSIHYKFKGSLNFERIPFDGVHISVGDLKKAIFAQKKIDTSTNDLIITDSQTKEGKFPILTHLTDY